MENIRSHPRHPDEPRKPGLYYVSLDELLSDVRHVLHRAQAGDHLMVTSGGEFGDPIVLIIPAVANDDLAWFYRGLADKKARSSAEAWTARAAPAAPPDGRSEEHAQ